MITDPPRSLRDITIAHADIIRTLGAGAVFGDVGERLAAQVTGSHRVNGKGRDLARRSDPGWTRPDPVGLDAPGPRRVRHEDYDEMWSPSDQARFRAWRDNASLQLGEVKTRQATDAWNGTEGWPLDTRSGGPNTPFFPMVDFYVFVLFDETGEVMMCRKLDLPEVIDFAETRGRRGGAWNYKIAIHREMTLGQDLTAEAREAAAELTASPQVKTPLTALG